MHACVANQPPKKGIFSMNRNKRFALLMLSLIVAASGAVAQPKKAAPAVKEYTIEQFMNTVRVGGSSFSADEKSLLFHTNQSGIFNVYSVAVTGGASKQLTNSKPTSSAGVTIANRFSFRRTNAIRASSMFMKCRSTRSSHR